MRRLISATAFVAVCVSGPFARPASAQGPAATETTVSAGLQLPGEVWVEALDQWLDTDLGLTARAGFDLVQVNTAFGGYAQLSLAGVEDEDATWLEFGVSLSMKIELAQGAGVKPAVEVGFRSVEMDGYDVSADGMAVNLNVEYQMPESLGGATIEFGFIAQPTGSDSELEWDVTFPPIFYVTAGVTF
jgi:hypothetical protein